ALHVVLDTITVFPRRKLRGHPSHCVHAQPRALNVLVIHDQRAVFLLDVIARRIRGDALEQQIGAFLSSACVHVGKVPASGPAATWDANRRGTPGVAPESAYAGSARSTATAFASFGGPMANTNMGNGLRRRSVGKMDFNFKPSWMPAGFSCRCLEL